MKEIHNIGEIKALTQSKLSIEIVQFGRAGFVQSRACEPLDIYLAVEGLKSFRRALQNANHDLIILDEILVAVDFGLLKAEKLCKILKTKPPELHVVITGHKAHKDILKMADLVTEMKEIKHPYQIGVRAQIGIEF
jgi:cob(I)alamin adenosyltransferase